MSYVRPARCVGPACPTCGCQDAKILAQPQAGAWWSSGKARCGFCGRVFGFREVPQEAQTPPVEYQELPAVEHQDPLVIEQRNVEFPVLRCPSCGKKAGRKGTGGPKVTSTQGRIRYHECSCGHHFKSVERD